MKTYKKRILICGLWISSVLASFCAGAFFIYELLIFNDPVSESKVYINVYPPVDGPLYNTEDFIRANNEVKDYLVEQVKRPEFSKLRPRFIVVPDISGYTIYSSSGLRGTDFPYELYKSTNKVMKKSLDYIKAKPLPPDE